MPVSTCKRLAALSATAVVVDTVEPAHLDLKVEVFDSSTVNISGGWILDDLRAAGSSTVSLLGGPSEDVVRIFHNPTPTG